MYFDLQTLFNLIESLWIDQIEAGPGGAGKVQADQLVLSEQVGSRTERIIVFSIFHHLTALLAFFLVFSLLQ